MGAIVDDCVPAGAVAVLRSWGWDARFARQVLGDSETDSSIYKLASDLREVVVTANTKDFQKLHATYERRYRDALLLICLARNGSKCDRRLGESREIIEYELSRRRARSCATLIEIRMEAIMVHR